MKDTQEFLRIDHLSREHWHGLAVQFAKLDCSLLNLLDWENRNLALLPVALQSVLTPKLNELALDAAREELRMGERTQETVQTLNRAVWNFLKPWGRELALPVTPKQLNRE